MAVQIVFLILLPVAIFGGETVDLSSPAFVVPYRGHLINIFEPIQPPPVTGPQPTPYLFFPSIYASPVPMPKQVSRYYYPPTATLLTNTAELFRSPANDLYFVNVKLRLRDNDYHQQMTNLVHSVTGNARSQVLPIPFHWLQVHYYTGDGSFKMRTQWQLCLDDRQVMSLDIRCVRFDQCDQIRKTIRRKIPGLSFHVELYFLQSPWRTVRKAEISVINAHLTNSLMYDAISGQLNASRYVFVEMQDYYTLVQEILTNSINSVLEPAEYVSDEQQVNLMMRLVPVFRHNVTSSGEFSDAMWQATFWPSHKQRPDQKLKDFRSLFSDGNKWFERVMRGDNITADVDSARSPSLLSALAELRSPNTTVQWDGQKLVITPIQMVCLDLEKLRDQVEFRKFFIDISSFNTDYVVYADNSDEPDTIVPQRQYEDLVERMQATMSPIGSIQAFPVGVAGPPCWIPCDGEKFKASTYPQLASVFADHRTPDLRGRFLLGHQNGTYPLGSSGGEAKHQLTVEEMPTHNHAVAVGSRSGKSFLPSYIATFGDANVLKDNPAETAFAGGNVPHNNMPPYYTVAYYVRAC